MLYIYYMKNKLFLFIFFLFLPVFVLAQVTVVRVKDTTVYLDTSTLKTPPQKGDVFKVIVSSEKLTNPKTGKDLGLVYNYSPVGTITEVQPLYAIGKLPSAKEVAVGQEAVLEKPTAASSQTPAAVAASTLDAPAQEQHSKKTFQPIDQEIISLSAAAVTAPQAEDIITLSKQGRVSVWKRQGEKLEEAFFYQLPAQLTPLTLSAAPLRQQELAEIFVTVYEERVPRISTLVLARGNNQWTVLDTLPYFVKELGCAANKQIWAQRPFVLGSAPGNAHEVLFEKGKFTLTAARLGTQHTWLQGINLFPVKEQEEGLLYTSSKGKIALLLPNGKTVTGKGLGTGAANRVKYKQEIVKIYPSLQVVSSQGRAQAAVVENTAKFGLLSSTFGQYESGKIHFLSLEKGRLVTTDTVELDGFVYDTACANNTVLSAEILPDGQSTVVEILNN